MLAALAVMPLAIPIPAITGAATTATATAATATATTAIPVSIVLSFGQFPDESLLLTGLLKQYENILFPISSPPTPEIPESALINRPVSGL